MSIPKGSHPIDLEERRSQEFEAIQSSFRSFLSLRHMAIGSRLSVAFGIMIVLALVPALTVYTTNRLKDRALEQHLSALEAAQTAEPAIAAEALDRFRRVERLSQNVNLAVVGIVLVSGVTLAFVVTRGIADPIVHLTAVAERVAEGDLTAQARLTSKDEIGWLAVTFNGMVSQFRNTLSNLEQRVHERTQALGTSAVISRQLTTILDPDELLRQIVNNIKNAFGYYHVHIYLLDNRTQALVLREGTGEIGYQLKANGHKLQAGQGIVGRSAARREAILAPNVDEFPGFFRNPLLPKTQAELAVPLWKGETVLGVLDMQSEEVGGFSQEDLTLMQSVADQVVVALENARLFEQSRAALAEVEALNRRLTRETWRDIETLVETPGYVFAESEVAPISTEWIPAMTEALQRKSIAHRAEDEDQHDASSRASSVAIPLTLRGEVIGVIGIERTSPERANGAENGSRKANGAWSQDELATIRSVVEQVALALDAARLNRDTIRSAWRDQIVSEATAKIWSSSEVDEVMKAAVAQLGEKLRATEVVIQLGTNAELVSEGRE